MGIISFIQILFDAQPIIFVFVFKIFLKYFLLPAAGSYSQKFAAKKSQSLGKC
jgi:hypothetical protein